MSAVPTTLPIPLPNAVTWDEIDLMLTCTRVVVRLAQYSNHEIAEILRAIANRIDTEG